MLLRIDVFRNIPKLWDGEAVETEIIDQFEINL